MRPNETEEAISVRSRWGYESWLFVDASGVQRGEGRRLRVCYRARLRNLHSATQKCHWGLLSGYLRTKYESYLLYSGSEKILDSTTKGQLNHFVDRRIIILRITTTNNTLTYILEIRVPKENNMQTNTMAVIHQRNNVKRTWWQRKRTHHLACTQILYFCGRKVEELHTCSLSCLTSAPWRTLIFPDPMYSRYRVILMHAVKTL